MSQIQNMPVCDLRNIRSIEEAQAISGIRNVALLILPQDAPPAVNAALLAVPKENIAAIVSLDADAAVNMVNGVHELRDSDFGAAGETMLLVNGICIGRRLSANVRGKIIVNGIVLLHEQFKAGGDIEFLMVNGLTRYVDFDDVKTFPNTLDINDEFLEYLPENTVVTVGNTATFDDTVTVDMLRDKKVFFIVGNTIVCPPALMAYLKATATYGNELRLPGQADE
ncbi:MAG: hypothetical protein PHO66_01220 [Eubacteriales bacterium]|nr:hypothetical protein [Eubacteriales bacterium]